MGPSVRRVALLSFLALVTACAGCSSGEGGGRRHFFTFRDDDCDGVEDAPGGPDLVQDDADSDGVGDRCDNCPNVASADSRDTDRDGFGNPCDVDDDNDGVADASDNCPFRPNAGQAATDQDGDGVPDECDNCLTTANPRHAVSTNCNADDDVDDPGERSGEQCDVEQDGFGDACDLDDDDDGVVDGDDVCPFRFDPTQADADGDGTGDACELT